MPEPTLIQIADDARTDPKIVRLVEPGDRPIIPMFTYLVSEDGADRYFIQVNTPNRNLSQFSPSPFASTTLSQMLALVENRGYTREALVSDLRLYEAEVLAKIDGRDRPEPAYDRPVTATTWRTATGPEVQRYLQLTTAPAGAIEADRRIGELAQSGETAVPVLVTADTLDHHILVAGATGSGKSHLLSNLSHIAADMGRAVVLFDHKPDHQDHHRENPGARHPRGLALEGITDVPRVRYWTLDPTDRSTLAKQLTVKAMDLDGEILAGTIFHKKGEEVQAKTFATIADAFSAERKARGDSWTIRELIQYVRGTDTKALESKLNDGNIRLHTGSVNAIKRKLLPASIRARVPSFIDTEETAPGGSRRRPTTKAEIDRVFQPGVNVIRISDSESRAYGLFLSHILDRASKGREKRLEPPDGARRLWDKPTPELMIVIDEAADIFKAESSYLKNTTTGMLAGQIRRGRSLKMSYVIAVQDAGDVPETIRHNLNSAIVGRHRHMKTLREALPTIRESLLANAGALRPGEMYAEIFRVPSLMLVRLDQSRSMLTT